MPETIDDQRGDTGGSPKYGRRGGRQALVYLQRQMDKGEEVTESEMAANIKFAKALRDSPESSPRDRMRAVEFLDGVVARGVSIALATTSMDQRDDHKDIDIKHGIQVGQATQVQVIIMPPGAELPPAPQVVVEPPQIEGKT